MKIMYQNEILNTDDLEKLGYGDEGVVYKYLDKALKVYWHTPRKRVLSYDFLGDLMTIKTQRIILPTDYIYKLEDDDCGYYNGYSIKLIDHKIPLTNIELTLDKLNYEEEKIIKDLEILEKNNLEIIDLASKGNFIYNNEFYFVDPGSYHYSKEQNLGISNLNEVNNALNTNLFLMNNKKSDLKNELSEILQINKNLITDDILSLCMQIYKNTTSTIQFTKKNYFTFLKEVISYYQSIKNYKLQLIRQALNQNIEENYLEAQDQLKRILS